MVLIVGECFVGFSTVCFGVLQMQFPSVVCGMSFLNFNFGSGCALVVQGDFSPRAESAGSRVAGCISFGTFFFLFFEFVIGFQGGSGVIWGCRGIFSLSRDRGGEDRVYLVWECFFRFSLVFCRIPEGVDGPWCRRGIIFRFVQSVCQVGVRLVGGVFVWEFSLFRSLPSVLQVSAGIEFPLVTLIDFPFVQRVWA